MSGDLANGGETVVADHVVSHVWEHTYLLWFEDQLTPHLRPSKPPAAADLSRAKWGIGGQGVWLWEGKVWPGSSRTPDSRTAVAIDGPRKLLFLAVGQYISPRLMLLADPGPRTGCFSTAGARARWRLAKMLQEFGRGFCTAAGGRWRHISGLGHSRYGW